MKYAVKLTHREGGHKTLLKDGDEFPWTLTMFQLYVQKMCKLHPNSYTHCTWPPQPVPTMPPIQLVSEAERTALDIIATAMEAEVRWKEDGIPQPAKWAAYKVLCKAIRREVK